MNDRKLYMTKIQVVVMTRNESACQDTAEIIARATDSVRNEYLDTVIITSVDQTIPLTEFDAEAIAHKLNIEPDRLGLTQYEPNGLHSQGYSTALSDILQIEKVKDEGNAEPEQLTGGD